MVKFGKFVVLLLLPLVFAGFLSVGYAQLSVDTSIINMSGSDWSLKVDSALASSIDSRNTPYMTAKSSTEKELFLELASLEDCKSGVVQFKIDMIGLTAYKQLPLTQEEIDSGSFRPKNVENSFALFDSDGRKVAHIYGSKITDAKGVEVWLNQDLSEGLLTIHLPKPEVLETLTFPLLLDPSFGYTSIGATSGGSADTVWYSRYQVPVDCDTIEALAVYTNASNVKIGVYNDSSTNPQSLISSSETIVGVSGWEEKTGLSIAVTPESYVWLAFCIDSSTFNFDSASAVDRYESLAYASALPASVGSLTTENSVKISIYANYTAIGDPTPTPTPTATPEGATATPFPEGAMDDTDWWISILLLAVVVINVVLIAVPFALLRFVFACMAFLLAALCLSYQIPLSPYMQSLGMVVSVVCMFLAARARE